MDRPMRHLLFEVVLRVRMLEAVAVMDDGELPEAVMVHDVRPSEVLARALGELMEVLDPHD